MKKLMIVLVLMPLVVFADTENVDGITWNFSVKSGAATIESYYVYSERQPAIPSSTTGAITVPSRLGGCPVTSIGDSAFSCCSGLTSVTIPEGVTSIGDGAFLCCGALTSVTIPEGVTNIGEIAFEECGSLTSVTIPESVTSIGYGAFVYSGLTSVTIPSSVTNFGGGAFSCCYKLTSATLSSSVMSVGDYTFAGCGALTSVTIPEGVTNIGECAFESCGSLTLVAIPSSVTSIGDGAFAGCSRLAEVTIPSSVTSIGTGAFFSCIGLKSVTIPLSVTNIGSRAFAGCSGMTEVTIPSSVTSIGDGAFDSCSGLMSVTIPEGVTSIGDGAFHECTGLTSVTIPSSVTNIGDNTFFGCSGLTSVTIPSGVTNIGDRAFAGCSGLTSMTIPSSVTNIGSRAFLGCSGLTSVTMPSGVTNIGDGAFAGCLNLGKIVLDPSNAYFKIKQGKLMAKDGRVIVDCSLRVDVISSQIRENDPTVMDVTYKIRSLCPTVKVRVLAFEDGERSFAKVVRPETFADGTGVNVGDEVEPNVEHTISWKVSSDWQTKLAKVKFEVLAREAELLPLETMTIPASDQYGKMKVTWNVISESQVFDALMWLYADKDPGLTLSGGVLYGNGVNLARGTELGHKTYDWSDAYWDFDCRVNAVKYVLQKMGYSLLTGAPLTYANQETRLGLSPSGTRQYGYKIEE